MAGYLKSTDLYRNELKRLETAMSGQVAWLKSWHLRLFSDELADELSDRNLEHSPFRSWYYGLPRGLFSDSPLFIARVNPRDDIHT